MIGDPATATGFIIDNDGMVRRYTIHVEKQCDQMAIDLVSVDSLLHRVSVVFMRFQMG